MASVSLESSLKLNAIYRAIQDDIFRKIDCHNGHLKPTAEGCDYCGYSYRGAAECDVEALCRSTFEEEPDEIGIYHRLPEEW